MESFITLEAILISILIPGVMYITQPKFVATLNRVAKKISKR